jgi:cobalamin synthase
MFGRGMAVILCSAYPISPHASLGRLAALPPQPVLFISIVFWLIPLWLIAGPAGLIAACLGGILLLWTGRIATTKLGGITGDIIGSAILLSETAFLIGLVGVLA